MKRKELMLLIADYGAICTMYGANSESTADAYFQKAIRDTVRKIEAELIRWQEHGAPKETES